MSEQIGRARADHAPIEDGATVVADSVAILVYLAMKYDPARSWLPTDPAQAAEVQRWLSVAQGPVFNGPCSARLVTVFAYPLDLERAKTIAHDLFTVLDPHLAGRHFLVGQAPTIADVALYSYIAHAPEGGVSLAPFANILAWLGRIAALPNFEAMPSTKAGLVA